MDDDINEGNKNTLAFGRHSLQSQCVEHPEHQSLLWYASRIIAHYFSFPGKFFERLDSCTYKHIVEHICFMPGIFLRRKEDRFKVLNRISDSTVNSGITAKDTRPLGMAVIPYCTSNRARRATTTTASCLLTICLRSNYRRPLSAHATAWSSRFSCTSNTRTQNGQSEEDRKTEERRHLLQ